ncbi:hypothetical protein PR048_004367 [Dryococelus australis]|uniref:Uncharacterized protein n=1 Tax=Dryococelus australis TaxID=614101 RepID=A0ABQ9I587_9NEOP|nr:hypothetical protein PR048_004367 [Dryococelus australis]
MVGVTEPLSGVTMPAHKRIAKRPKLTVFTLGVLRRSEFQNQPQWFLRGQWLDYWPPTCANQVPFPAGSFPDFRMWEYRPSDVAGRRVFSGMSRFLRPRILALLRFHLAHPNRLSRPPRMGTITRINCFSWKAVRAGSTSTYTCTLANLLRPLAACLCEKAVSAHLGRSTVFDTSWRTLGQSWPFTVRSDNQCAVDFIILAHIVSSLQLRVARTPPPPSLVQSPALPRRGRWKDAEAAGNSLRVLVARASPSPLVFVPTRPSCAFCARPPSDVPPPVQNSCPVAPPPPPSATTASSQRRAAVSGRHGSSTLTADAARHGPALLSLLKTYRRFSAPVDLVRIYNDPSVNHHFTTVCPNHVQYSRKGVASRLCSGQWRSDSGFSTDNARTLRSEVRHRRTLVCGKGSYGKDKVGEMENGEIWATVIIWVLKSRRGRSEGSMEQRRHANSGGNGRYRENPPTGSIVRQDLPHAKIRARPRRDSNPVRLYSYVKNYHRRHHFQTGLELTVFVRASSSGTLLTFRYRSRCETDDNPTFCTLHSARTGAGLSKPPLQLCPVGEISPELRSACRLFQVCHIRRLLLAGWLEALWVGIRFFYSWPAPFSSKDSHLLELSTQFLPPPDVAPPRREGRVTSVRRVHTGGRLPSENEGLVPGHSVTH